MTIPEDPSDFISKIYSTYEAVRSNSENDSFKDLKVQDVIFKTLKSAIQQEIVPKENKTLLEKLETLKEKKIIDLTDQEHSQIQHAFQNRTLSPADSGIDCEEASPPATPLSPQIKKVSSFIQKFFDFFKDFNPAPSGVAVFMQPTILRTPSRELSFMNQYVFSHETNMDNGLESLKGIKDMQRLLARSFNETRADTPSTDTAKLAVLQKSTDSVLQPEKQTLVDNTSVPTQFFVDHIENQRFAFVNLSLPSGDTHIIDSKKKALEFLTEAKRFCELLTQNQPQEVKQALLNAVLLFSTQASLNPINLDGMQTILRLNQETEGGVFSLKPASSSIQFNEAIENGNVVPLTFDVTVKASLVDTAKLSLKEGGSPQQFKQVTENLGIDYVVKSETQAIFRVSYNPENSSFHVEFNKPTSTSYSLNPKALI